MTSFLQFRNHVSMGLVKVVKVSFSWFEKGFSIYNSNLLLKLPLLHTHADLKAKEETLSLNCKHVILLPQSAPLDGTVKMRN